MTAIATYGDLRAALSEHVNHRNISSVLPRLVQMAESYLNREMRTRYQITYGTLTFTSGVANLPEDFLEFAHLYGLNGSQYRSGPLSTSRALSTQWSRYSIDGSKVYIDGFSGGRDLVYFAKLPTLTVGNSTTNWLLTRYPDVYLYAVGLEAAKHLKDADLLTITKTLLDDSLLSVRVDDDRARWSNTTVRVQGINP